MAGQGGEVVAGRGQQIDVIVPSLGVNPSVYGVKVGVEQGHHHVVGIVVIVAIPGSPVQQHLTRSFLAYKIIPQDIQQPCHCHGFFVKNVVLDGCHGVGDRPQPHALDIACVISGATVVIVLAFSNAVTDQKGEKRRR